MARSLAGASYTLSVIIAARLARRPDLVARLIKAAKDRDEDPGHMIEDAIALHLDAIEHFELPAGASLAEIDPAPLPAGSPPRPGPVECSGGADHA